MMGKREAVRCILNGRGADRIPVIMNAGSLSLSQYGYNAREAAQEPNKLVECVLGTQEKFGFDGLYAGSYSVTSMMAGHLLNTEGIISKSGEETIRSIDDIKKMRPYNPERCELMENRIKSIELLRKEKPDEPIFVIANHPTSVAFKLLGGKLGFKSLVKYPELFTELCNAVEDACLLAYKKLATTDLDFFWLPTPNFGGFCISRKSYIKCIYESNVRFMKKMKTINCKIILHPCGLYDDRLDLVLDEEGDAWHISDTSTKKIKELYGDKVSLMGCIPSVAGMLESSSEDLYKFAYQECLDGAKDGRFILSADCDVPPATSVENMQAVIRAARDAEKVLFK